MGKGAVASVSRLFIATAALFALPHLLSASAHVAVKKSGAEESNKTWISGGILNDSAYELLTAIRADSSILCGKKRYGLERIDEFVQKRFLLEDGERRLNDMLNHAYSLYLMDRENGCLNPYAVYPDRISIQKSESESRENILLKRLENVLKKYEKIEMEGGWEKIPPFPGLLKKGDFSEIVKDIKARLYISGDYNGSDITDPFFGDDLENGVKLFQKRHALKADGIVGPNTLRAMNIPVERKILLIKLNIERLRWLTSGSEDFIAANIPAYTLTLYRKSLPVLEMKSIVGRKDRPTPMLSDIMSYAVLNPYWRAPKTIVREDILPKLKAGMFDYLESIGIVVSKSMDGNETVDMRSVDWSRYNGGELPFVFMQKPGPLNYLGFVKFMFPNDFDIYIHDTPHSGLFKYKKRELSSGCIRVEKPVELFHAVFNSDKEGRWSYKEIIRQIIKKEEKLVGLSRPLPVYILYMTVFADDEGMVHFLQDIYGYDNIMEQYIKESIHENESVETPLRAGRVFK